MTNKYLEKIAAVLSDEEHAALAEEMKKPWTIIGQKEIARKHGFDVNHSDMMRLNTQIANAAPMESLKNQLLYPLGGGLAGAGAGALFARTPEAVAGGALLGYIAGAVKGIHGEAKMINRERPVEIRKAIEGGQWKKFS